MEEILENLSGLTGVQGCLIAGRDGLLIAQSWHNEIDAELAGASLADIFVTAESSVSERFALGLIDMITIEATGGKIFIQNINEDTFLVVLAQANSNIGLLRCEIKYAVENLKEVF